MFSVIGPIFINFTIYLVYSISDLIYLGLTSLSTHCMGYVATSSYKDLGNQHIIVVKILHCYLFGIGKQLPTVPHRVRGFGWQIQVQVRYPMHHRALSTWFKIALIVLLQVSMSQKKKTDLMSFLLNLPSLPTVVAIWYHQLCS